VTALAVARLLVRYRWRSIWNGAFRVPRQRPMRVAWFLMLLAPVAYVGLFSTAFALIAETAPLPAQVAVLALVAGVIALASVCGKMATSETVVGGSGENEFLLTRPLSLATLVTARSLAGVASNVFDALFLFPVLVSAALVWELGLAGVLMAALVSVIVQVGVSAVAQAGQILVVRVVPPAHRRMVWSGLALLAALSMACLWMVATAVLRRPLPLAEALQGWTGVLRLSPGGLIVAPLAALARGWGPGALLVLAAPLELTVLAMVLADALVRWAGQAGWEQAGTPWAEAARGPTPGARMNLFTKDWLLILRDRSRLVTLLALPAIFVGVQVFGSIGWSWTTGTARHVAVLAYSLSAYMAGFGPLFHMESERRAFWLLRVAPVSLGRLLAWKAAFWSTVVGAAAAVVGFGLLLVSRLPLTADGLGLVALAVVGAVTASCLAVAMASAVADFSDDTRRAVGPGTLYLFLLVASLFNIALLEGGAVRLRTLALYLAALALHWVAGIDGAARVFDPEPRRDRPLRAGDGATMAILLYLGGPAQHLAGVPDAPWIAGIWPAILVMVAAVHLVGRRHQTAPLALAPALGVGLAAGALASAPGWWHGGHALGLVLGVALVRAAAEELIVRGVIQGGLAARGRWPALVASAGIALLVGARPFGAGAVVVAVAPALVLALTGRLAAAGVARIVLELVV
jgi:hypothetical protein